MTDAEWELIEALLPSERGRKSCPAQDNRRYLNGMLHVLRVGCPFPSKQLALSTIRASP
ncbi:transposase [Labrenzia sp. 011]|uniref:transposase n=1 Tax=Labrenzia sp. 011 TaxID=2171494 RepID=UPI002447CF47|nr:transposase [Labrenzia sp. 011]